MGEYTSEKYQADKLLKANDGIECPICHKNFLKLVMHTKLKHGVGKEELINNGVTEFNHARYKEFLEKPRQRRLEKTRLNFNKKSLSIPSEWWPSDCLYVRIKIENKLRQIHFNPVNKPLEDTHKLTIFRSKHKHWFRINISQKIAESLEIEEPKLQYSGHNVILQLEGEELLYDFQAWANWNITQLSSITITKSNKTISIPKFIWPLNAEYVYLEFNKNFLDLFPVTKAEQISTTKRGKLVLGQYIDLSECLKLFPHQNRFQIRAAKFFSNNDLPVDNWEFQGQKPDGRLRFKHRKI
jgi:hypothetical protein